MEFQYWHLAVVAGFVAGLVVLVRWGVRVSRQATTVVSAAVLLVVSALLFQTLVLDEAYLESDWNGRLDDLGLIGVPALLGVGLIALAVKRAGRGGPPGGTVDRG